MKKRGKMFFWRKKKETIHIPSFVSIEPISILTENPPKLTIIVGGSARLKSFYARALSHAIKNSIVSEDLSQEDSLEDSLLKFIALDLDNPVILYFYYLGVDWVVDFLSKDFFAGGSFSTKELVILSLDRFSDQAERTLDSLGISYFHPSFRETREAFCILYPEIGEDVFLDDPDRLCLIKFRSKESDCSREAKSMLGKSRFHILPF